VLRTLSVSTVLAVVLTAGAASAQPQLTLSAAAVAPGQPVTATVTGTPGRFFALIGSSVNAGFSYAGVPLSVGADVVILHLGQLPGSGTASVQFTPPFTGTIFDRYYVQAVTSTAPNFVPPEPGQSAVVRNSDVVSASLGVARTGLVTLNVPAGSYVLHGVVQVGNTTGTDFAASCRFNAPSGTFYDSALFVPAGRSQTMPLLGVMTASSSVTVSVTCTPSPPAGVAFTPAIVAVPAASIAGSSLAPDGSQ
jgi:hypothetical protein